ALLDEFEPGAEASEIARVFDALRADLVPLVKAIAVAKPIGEELLDRDYPIAAQEAFGRMILEKMSYPAGKRGRLDISAHPFTTTLGRDDVRITTRYSPRNFAPGFFSIVHEAGHGLYELGFEAGLSPMLANAASLGIHESQSRTWENLVGR